MGIQNQNIISYKPNADINCYCYITVLTSGAIQSGVPQKVLVVMSPEMFSLHMPKSAILQWPSASSKMLSNFRSLQMMRNFFFKHYRYIFFIKKALLRNIIHLFLKSTINKVRSRGFGRPTFRQTCTSVANHEDMDSLFPFLTKLEAHIIQLNFFLVHQNKRSI